MAALRGLLRGDYRLESPPPSARHLRSPPPAECPETGRTDLRKPPQAFGVQKAVRTQDRTGKCFFPLGDGTERGRGVGQTEVVVGVRNRETGGREREDTFTNRDRPRRRQGGPSRPARGRHVHARVAEKQQGTSSPEGRGCAAAVPGVEHPTALAIPA